MTKTAFWLENLLAVFFHELLSSGEASTTTCGVCARPRGTKYQRITIPSDALGPQEPAGPDARPPRGALARIQGWLTSND